MLKDEKTNLQTLRAVGNSEALENFKLILNTHMDFYEQYKAKHSEA